MSQTDLRLIAAAEPTDLVPEVRAALAQLSKSNDNGVGFVVTRSGVMWVRANLRDAKTFHLCSGDVAPWTGELTPFWDRENRVLSFGGQIIRRYIRSSPNQEAVLQAFEEQGWPYRIDDPLPQDHEVVPKVRLHDTIRWLNLKHESRLLRFLGDGTGEGVCWKKLASGSLVLHRDSAEELRRAA